MPPVLTQRSSKVDQKDKKVWKEVWTCKDKSIRKMLRGRYTEKEKKGEEDEEENHEWDEEKDSQSHFV